MIWVCKLSELYVTRGHGFSKKLYIHPAARNSFRFYTETNLLAMLDLCVDLPMHFRTALNSHFLGMEAQTDDNMTKVRYRLGDIVDTKTY